MAQFLCAILRMKNLLYIVLFALVTPVASSYAQHHPQRTPEDIARKQTEMMVRELDIQDSLVRDTLYRMHLKFALKRTISNTRSEAMQYMMEANAELQHILTPEQYQQFMNQQVNHTPHRPRPHYNRFTVTPTDSTSPPNDSEQASHTPPPPPGHQP